MAGEVRPRAAEALAAGMRSEAAAELRRLGGEYPADRTIEHAAVCAALATAYELGRIAEVLEAWQQSSAWDGGRS